MTGTLSKTSVRWIALTLLGLFFLCFVGFWYVSPYLAVRSLVRSMESGDKAAMSKFIDYPAVRFNVQKQINNQIELELAERSKPGMSSASIDAYSFALVDKLVRNMVSEKGIDSLIKGKKPFSPVKASSGEKDSSDTTVFNYNSHYGLNMDQFDVELSEAGCPKKTVSIELSREGFFFWKVSNILLPVNP